MKNVYHIISGLSVMHDMDANAAVANHPDEWSNTPWTPAQSKAYVEAAKAKHKEDTAAAKEIGMGPPPPPVPAPRELYPDEQAILDKHNEDVAAAVERLKTVDKEEAEANAKAAQTAIDRELVKRPPPVFDPNRPKPVEPKPEEHAVEPKSHPHGPKPEASSSSRKPYP